MLAGQSISAIDFTSLTAVGYKIDLRMMGPIALVAFPSLVTVGSHYWVYDNDMVQVVSASQPVNHTSSHRPLSTSQPHTMPWPPLATSQPHIMPSQSRLRASKWCQQSRFEMYI